MAQLEKRKAMAGALAHSPLSPAQYGNYFIHQKDHYDTSQDLIENGPAWSSSKWKNT